MTESHRLDVEYRIISDVDGHVSDSRDPEYAEQRARELDEEYPDQTHRVEEVTLPW